MVGVVELGVARDEALVSCNGREANSETLVLAHDSESVVSEAGLGRDRDQLVVLTLWGCKRSQASATTDKAPRGKKVKRRRWLRLLTEETGQRGMTRGKSDRGEGDTRFTNAWRCPRCLTRLVPWGWCIGVVGWGGIVGRMGSYPQRPCQGDLSLLATAHLTRKCGRKRGKEWRAKPHSLF